MDYNRIKNQLKTVCSSTKYFTRDFLKLYTKALEIGRKYDKDGTDDGYIKDGIFLRHRFDDIYNSDFYKLNGCAYCEFLAIVAGI